MTRKERRQMWEERISTFKASGESVTNWCAAHDIKAYQLYYWLKKLDAKVPIGIPSSRWMAVEVNKYDEESERSILVKVGQATVEVKPGFDPTLLADVVRALGVRC
ncbi:hypothetical protein AM501_02290 [Aneurinibacillus migulanus]|uniref:IS66 family insertion sequence element accessory protein TnpA n=1 Tax=Aneurinibacillus migulanus TaxID=47500 RepID=UPI0005BB213B|nr:hypothetical protein [Aneurinibacillus migulanus]KIV54643.1 hypothetical protein TS64_16710 [Aneurinibacillus migulanus]KPD09790.1 hypothetical protein AM501_02290 [Aneurinibacillus migulanus]